MPLRREVWSLFSGAMGLDIGLERAGLPPSLVVERDKVCCETIRLNRPKLSLIEGDVSTLTGDDFRTERDFAGDVFLMVGGPPCQSFSPGGNRAALSDPRGNLIYEYLRLIGEVRPRFFAMENVGNLITAALSHREIADRPGKQWNLGSYSNQARSKASDDGAEQMRPEELSGSAIRQILKDVSLLGYAIRFGVLNAADYGASQHRLRFVMLGSRELPPVDLPPPTHGDPMFGQLPFVPLREAIYDLRESPGPHSEYMPETKRYFALVPPGGYWRDLPPDIQRQALGPSFFSGGGKTGFFRRLSYDAPSPTVTTKPNRKGTAMCHPEFLRPLSVRECARIQGFPDEWKFTGAMNQQYQQIGNAVPTHLGFAIGRAILAGSRLRSKAVLRCDEYPSEFESMLGAASRRLRAAARNKVGRGPEATLFTVA